MVKISSNSGVRSARLYKPKARSRITNGSSILPNVDGRSIWVRRYRDIVALILADLGGDDHASESEKAIVRKAAALEVELERRTMLAANAGEMSDTFLEAYSRTSNTLRRLLQAVGLERRAKTIGGPSLGELIRQDQEQERRRLAAERSARQEASQ